MSQELDPAIISKESSSFGARTIELVYPPTDSICSEKDVITPQDPELVDQLFLAREEGPCGGVNMSEAVLDRLIDFRQQYEQDTGQTIGLYANHPPSKGAERTRLYLDANVKFGVPIQEIPTENSILLLSAHGVSTEEIEKARKAGLFIVDTTCPKVGFIHLQIGRAARLLGPSISPEEVGVVFVTDKGGYNPQHPEVKGTRGVAEYNGFRFLPITSTLEVMQLAAGRNDVGPDSVGLGGLKRVMIAGLTTSNSDEVAGLADLFEEKLSDSTSPVSLISGYDERSVCKTVKYRQDAVRQMVKAKQVETLIVVGALGSNNTNRLVDVARETARIMSPEMLRLRRIVFANSHHDVPRVWGDVGVVSGASTQQLNVDQIVQKLNVPTDRTARLGSAEQSDMYRPMGDDTSLARRVLLGDFSWFTHTRITA